MLPFLIGCAVVVFSALYAARRIYSQKLAEAFGLGIDFGKAIQAMTDDAKAQIVAQALPGAVPAPRSSQELVIE